MKEKPKEGELAKVIYETGRDGDFKKTQNGWFSALYGPFRRFEGDDSDEKDLKKTSRRLPAHITAFKQGVALPESIEWLKKLDHASFRDKKAKERLNDVLEFINTSTLLPNGISNCSVSAEGIFFDDADGNKLTIYDLSDGYQSILSMVLEILRQMERQHLRYKFITTSNKELIVGLSGVIMIDEIDVHLHPTWQVRIGEWFVKYFPNIQFIVTTHSPLLCQSAANGSIWKLADIGTDQEPRKLEGVEFKRLVYGNILEAMGTGAFGHQVARSRKSQQMLEKLSSMETRFAFGKLNEDEKKEMIELRKIFTTDDTIDL